MPKKKKVTAKVLKKVQTKNKKAPAKALKKSKQVLNTSKTSSAPRAVAMKKKATRRLEISPHDQIVHAAETYAVSIDEIIRSGNREYKLMQMNGRGQEITAPTISANSVKKLDAVEPKEPVAQEIEIEQIETIVSENIEPEKVEDALSEEDKKALAIVRAKLEASTVMIRSVSPLQTPFAHSSRKFVKETPEKTVSRAPLVVLSSAAIVFAAFVIAVVVSKTGGNFGPTQLITPQVQKVAGAETGPQQFEANGYTFSYPGNWYVTQTQNKVLTLRDSQKTTAQTIDLARSSLDGKSFQDWLKGQKSAETAQAVGTTTPQVYKASDSLYYVVGTSEVVVLSTTSSKAATQTVLMNVAKSLAFTK